MAVKDWYDQMDDGLAVAAPGFQGLFLVKGSANQQMINDLIQARPGSIIRGYKEGTIKYMPVGIPQWMYEYVAGMISEES